MFLAVLMIPALFMGAAGAEELSAESKATASQELEDLFTTLDLMDATISGLQAEIMAGHVTSERLTQMYIDRIRAYDRVMEALE